MENRLLAGKSPSFIFSKKEFTPTALIANVTVGAGLRPAPMKDNNQRR
jgi:hypothetical protein